MSGRYICADIAGNLRSLSLRCYSPMMARLTLRIDFEHGRALGPGKVRLLELVDEAGSISAAARSMEMSYRRAWLLIDAMNQTFREPVVVTRGGGAGGGGAALTAFGREVASSYRAMEREAADALAQRVTILEQALASPGDAPSTVAG